MKNQSMINSPSDICRYYIDTYIRQGDTVIDATAGNGHDTLILAKATGEHGHVLAFDIQQKALENTRKRLICANVLDRVELIHDSHVRMGQYVTQPVSGIFFNLGYLPGGNHALATTAEATVEAVKAGLDLLTAGGILCAVIYSGGDTGFAERDALLSLLEQIDYREYTVLLHQFFNRPNNPPMVAAIQKRVDKASAVL